MSLTKKHSKSVSVANASHRALAQREDKRRRVKVAKVRRSIVFLAALILPLSLVALLAIDYMYRPNSFEIDQVQYEGEFERVDLDKIESLTGQTVNGNFFTTNLEFVQSRLEGLPWVSRAAVRREWPSTIVIRVYEHKPAMRWESESWVSYQGELITASKQDKSSNFFKSMLRLSGDKSHAQEIMSQANIWQEQLKQESLFMQGITRTSSGAWSLELGNQQVEHTVKVLLGSELHRERLERFVRMYQKNNRLIAASKLIDVRYPNGMAIVPLKEAFSQQTSAG